MKAKPDPYWSLWGRIKAAWRRRLQFGDDYDACEGVKCYEDMVQADYEYREESSRPLLLPTRKIAICGAPDSLWWTVAGKSHHKKVTSDFHAVATLRKLDTDDEYFNSKFNSNL